MRLQDLHWMDVERYLQTDNRILLVTGATEQHAYLSLMTDVLIPSSIALAVAAREGILVAPALPFGVSGFFADFPGTISLTQTTFENVLNEMIGSLIQQGFGRFFILNGHGGNIMPARFDELASEGIAQITWYDWWRGNAATAFAEENGLQIDHANWGENFPFTRVETLPSDIANAEKAPINLGLIEEGQSARAILGDGAFGGRYQMDDTLMNALFARVVDEVVALVCNT